MYVAPCRKESSGVSEMRSYTVTTEKKWEEVAARVYGDSTKWVVIYRANWVEKLVAGTVLLIPDLVAKNA